MKDFDRGWCKRRKSWQLLRDARMRICIRQPQMYDWPLRSRGKHPSATLAPCFIRLFLEFFAARQACLADRRLIYCRFSRRRRMLQSDALSTSGLLT